MSFDAKCQVYSKLWRKFMDNFTADTLKKWPPLLQTFPKALNGFILHCEAKRVKVKRGCKFQRAFRSA